MILISAVTDIGPGGYRNSLVPQRGRADLSPQSFAHLIHIPVLAFHAEGDTTVPIQHIRKFHKTLLAEKTPTRLVQVPVARHDFHRVDPYIAQVRTEITDFLIARGLVDDRYPDHAAAADALLAEVTPQPPDEPSAT